MSESSTTHGVPPAVGRAPDHGVLGLVGWGTAALGVALVHNRLWASPNLALFAQNARERGRQPFDGPVTADYLLTNLSMPTIARALGQTSPHEYARLHLVVLLLGLVACSVVAYRRFGHVAARTLLVLCAAAPGVTVAMQWLGQPDALLFPIGLSLVLVRRRSTLLVLALLAGLTHPEQAALVVLVATGARLALRTSDVAGAEGTAVHAPDPSPVWRGGGLDLVTLLVGVGLARLVVQGYLWLADIEIRNPRSHYVDLGADVFWRHHTQSPWQLLYLLWGPLWLVVVAVASRLWRQRRAAADDGREGAGRSHAARSWGVLGVLAVLAVLPVAVTLDETRVYAMLTAPLVAAAAVLLAAQWSGVWLTRASAVLLVLTFVIPGGFTAGTASWSTDFDPGEFVPFLVSGSHPGDLDVWLMSPFHFVIPI